MARSKNWRNHPTVFFDIVRALRDNPETPVEIPYTSIGLARSKRLDFNSFKQGCMEAKFEEAFDHFKVGEEALWVLPQLETLVRDNPPRMIVQCKDFAADSIAVTEALAKRKKQLVGDNNG